jgi:FAD/FMN-containing dehydrogenase
MRRWNGWGEETIEARLPGEAVDFLSKRIGEAAAPKDATLSDVLAGVGPSRLPDHRLVSRDPAARLRASVGQSLEDWLRLRFGRVGVVVDGVAFPETEDEVREALQWALGAGALTIPVGGATSVVGHLTPGDGDRPSLAIVMTRLRGLIRLDPLSQLATVRVTRLPEREAFRGCFLPGWEAAETAAGELAQARIGVGRDHSRYLIAEKGERGVRAMRAMVEHFDPEGALDSGNLLPERLR